MLDMLLCNLLVSGNGTDALTGLLPTDRQLFPPTFVATITKDALSLKGVYSDYFRAVACNYSRDLACRIWAAR